MVGIGETFVGVGVGGLAGVDGFGVGVDGLSVVVGGGVVRTRFVGVGVEDFVNVGVDVFVGVGVLVGGVVCFCFLVGGVDDLGEE